MKELNKALHRTAHKAPPVTATVLLRKRHENYRRQRDDNGYGMKTSVYSPFSTLWKNISRVFHAMENFFPRHGKVELL